ncbi:T9SS type A sorting domain-containing protein [Hymenobacter psychrotolerans]|uniref:Por secretion system C-terminal sorting domain-containing protein n=1 Tax=Hymenobacter psychrotolerans DSM 18569 TaxID=1121959 RepID=A0A1M7C8C6_9BACT|nr:T9SS type A sorting domain-containing protein [Hymenobacter psychrotolerans]SHL63485.1 Por secretion system C-terminal sorting domain-containing protein [Hymenobacter psychrotolerans DSM 18569]
MKQFFRAGLLTALPADIRTLNNGYLSTNSGYYQILVRGRDQCGKTKQAGGLVRVNALTAALAGFRFNYGNGTQLTPSANPAAPTQLGAYGGGLDVTFSTGTYDSFRVRFDRYNPATGQYDLLVCQSPPIDVAGVMLSTVALNSLIYDSGCNPNANPVPGNPNTGPFFAQEGNFNTTFKLTLTVTNGCGTSAPVIGYFQPDTRLYRGGTAPAPVTVYPNPLQEGKARLEFTLPTAGPVSLQILDGTTGRERLVVLDKQPYGSGAQSIIFDTSTLPAGLYYYRLVTDKVTTGRLQKTEQ